MKKKFLTTIITPFIVLTGVYADANMPKAGIKSNGQLIYFEKQKDVESLSKMFQEGQFHGRLRNNNFYFWYDKEQTNKNKQMINAIGGSIVYNSATYNGFDFTAGLYGSRSFFDETKLDSISAIKPGKDTLSRFEYVNTGSKALYTVAQANIGYKFLQSKLILGRQLVETFYTKSNDTKMIPNSFDGAVLTSKYIKDTSIKLAYLTKEKLRDHKDAHSVFMVGDNASSSSVSPQWSEQDDSAMHKGLTYTAFKAAGKKTDAPLIVLDAQNSSLENTRINFASYVVPNLLSQAMGEINYKIKMDGFSITPGFRYIEQFDNGAGAVGGASIYNTGLSAYKDPNSLDARMIAARVVTAFKDYKINLGYTNILNKADLVTPWRGFPTAGYTRSMGMYNWRANAKSYRIELVKGAVKNGIYKDGFIQTSVLYIDGDTAKNDFERMFYYFGYIKNLQNYPEFQYRFRFGYNDFIAKSKDVPDYIDSRLEFNYLF